jgi:hypothetical protein
MRKYRLMVLPLMIAFMIGCDKVFMGESTTFAPGFSDAKFLKVSPGDSQYRILQLLGPALNVTTQQWSEIWIYTSNNIPNPASSGISSDRSGGYKTYISFNRAGIAESWWGDLITNRMAGLSKSEILAQFSNPSTTNLRDFAVVLHYSAPSKRGSGTYKRREVNLDTNGQVSSTVRAIYYD